MKKKALLIVGLALLMATAGVVYAHWSDTLVVDAQVRTGTFGIHWLEIFTDDDNGNVIGEELLAGGAALPTPLFGQGSVDPSSAAVVTSSGGLVTPASRYDKAIGNCASGIGLPVVQPGIMWVRADNVYPSYHCTIWSRFNNTGSVPAKVQSIVTNTYIGASTTPASIAAYGDWQTLAGTGCGLQVDPGEVITTVNTLHILQAAEQNQTYRVEQTITFVNWNEFDPAACFHTFNGFQAVLPMTTP
jgi:predicted ribosomally synthesized peptide with SipW-like signal peptide